MSFRSDQRQSQILSPRLQHAVRLLQMSSLDFGLLIRNGLGKNPFLEFEEAEDGPAHETHENHGPGGNTSGEAGAADALGWDGSRSEMESDRDVWHADAATGQSPVPDRDTSALDWLVAEQSLTMHLHGQLNTTALSARDLCLAHVVVESLDDDGYLRTPLEELLTLVQWEPPARLQDMEAALQQVQSLEPAGVGARSVAECLELQLQDIECPEMRVLAHAIVTEHLEALAARDTARLVHRLGVSRALVETVCDRIRRLDPRPGWRWGSSPSAYVVPDVIVRKIRGEWNARINPAVLPRVRINEVYVDLFRRHRTSENAEMGDHLQEARWTIRNVEQRFSTILDVAQVIVKHQRHFLDYGPMAMKPLGLREVADEIGVHESTVSRVTNNKYLAAPGGVFELKHFFSRAMAGEGGRECSGTAIRGLIQEMLQSESPADPLSDAEITRRLAGQGLVLARRTVTKYRQILRIEPVGRRRRLDV